MRYVVFQSGSKQYKASVGDIIEVDRLETEPEKNLQLSSILLYVHDGNSKVGAPYVDGVTLTGKVLGHVRGEKISVSKFKAKARYRKSSGFRASFTRIQIASITDKNDTEKEEKTPVEKQEVKKTVKRATKK